MRAMILVTAGVLIFTMAGAAWAQEVGEICPDILVPADDRGNERVSAFQRYPKQIIVVYYWSTVNNRSVELLSMVNELYERYRGRGVMMIGITPDKKEKGEEVWEEKELTFLGWFEVPEHPNWKYSAPPLAYIVDKYRRVAYARFDPEDGLEEKILEVLQRTPPLNATEERLNQNFAKVGQLLAQHEIGRAYTLAKDLEGLFRGVAEDDHRQQVEDLLQQIRHGAVTWLELAREEIKNEDYQSACRKLSDLSIRLEREDEDEDNDRRGRSRRSSSRSRRDRRDRRNRTDTGEVEEIQTYRELKEQIDQEIGRMQADSSVKSIIRKAMDNAKGQIKNDEAAELREDASYFAARELYREVTEEYPETEAAKIAQQAIDQINGDAQIRAEIRKVQAANQAARWYDLGRRHARMKFYDLAREYYEKVIKEYPDSTAAEKAKQELKKLDENEKSE